MITNTGIVFIHGAGLNSSIWDELINEIAAPVLTIDFPNRKSNGLTNSRLSFDDYVNSTIEQIQHWNSTYFVIVAHSIGACVGLKIAGHLKNELSGFVAIGSVIPENGDSFVTSLPFPQKLIMPVILNLFGTKPPKKSIETELCNDLSAEQTSKIVNEFTPESRALYTTKITYELPATQRLYIKLTNDKSIPEALQQRMAENFVATNIITLDSGHLPMISKVNELASILTEFVNNSG